MSSLFLFLSLSVFSVSVLLFVSLPECICLSFHQYVLFHPLYCLYLSSQRNGGIPAFATEVDSCFGFSMFVFVTNVQSYSLSNKQKSPFKQTNEQSRLLFCFFFSNVVSVTSVRLYRYVQIRSLTNKQTNQPIQTNKPVQTEK